MGFRRLGFGWALVCFAGGALAQHGDDHFVRSGIPSGDTWWCASAPSAHLWPCFRFEDRCDAFRQGRSDRGVVVSACRQQRTAHCMTFFENETGQFLCLGSASSCAETRRGLFAENRLADLFPETHTFRYVISSCHPIGAVSEAVDEGRDASAVDVPHDAVIPIVPTEPEVDASALEPPNREAALAVLTAPMSALQRCLPRGNYQITVTFFNNGHVMAAEPDDIRGSYCTHAEIRDRPGIQMPAFRGAPFVVQYTITAQ